MTENQGLPASAGGAPHGVAAAQAPKAVALRRLRRLKARIVLATLLGFGALSALAAGHRVGAAAPTTSSPAATAPTRAPYNGDGASPFGGNNGGNSGNGWDNGGNGWGNDDGNTDNGGFFSQGGSGDQGGYGFGNGGGYQPPVAGSGAS